MMKLFHYILLFNVIILSAVFPASHENAKLTLFPLPNSGVDNKEANNIYTMIEEKIAKSGRFVLISSKDSEAASKALRIDNKNIDKENAINVGRYLDSNFIGLYQLKKETNYILSIEIIGIGYYSTESALYVKQMENLNSAEFEIDVAIDYLLERIFLVEIFFERNRQYLIGSIKTHKKIQTQEPMLSTDNFFIARKFYVALNTAYNFALGEYSILNPFLYLDLFFDYSLITSDILILSPYIKINYFQHDAYISATTQNLLGCVGFSGGFSLTFSIPDYRPLSIHLSGGCGVAASSVNWTQPISTDFMATSSLEVRHTFFNRLSASVFFSYMFINYLEPVLHELRAGVGVGYRL